jgi:acylphosphatase
VAAAASRVTRGRAVNKAAESEVVVRVRVIVSGRVQGVWYRESCRETAAIAGVSGWVRNNADGTVEAALEGEPGAVDRVVSWMRSGPRSAVVTKVDISSETPLGERGFVVR